MKKLSILLAISLTLAACTLTATPPPDKGNGDTKSDQSLEELSRDTLIAIKKQNWSEVAKVIHPQKGLRFSPYVNVNPAIEQIFTKEEFSTLDKEKVLYWGIYDGSGEPINLSFSDYYKRFIYNVDFVTSSEITLSDSELPTFGNIIDNTFDIYPDATAVQYHMPASEDGGLDWWSLRLIFEKMGENWYLTGIVHDQWTI